MADRRKRRQPLGSMPTARQQQRKRPHCPEKLTIVKAAVAIAILLSVVATTAAVIQGSAPKTRQCIDEPRRLVWEEHRVDLARRCMFRRMYRMEEQTFNKLAELLRPRLTPTAENVRLGGIIGWWVGVWMSGREQRGCTTVVLLYGVLGYRCFIAYCCHTTAPSLQPLLHPHGRVEVSCVLLLLLLHKRVVLSVACVHTPQQIS